MIVMRAYADQTITIEMIEIAVLSTDQYGSM